MEQAARDGPVAIRAHQVRIRLGFPLQNAPLASTRLTRGNGPWGNRTWTYDKIGNRVTFARSSEPTQTYAYASPGHNPKLSTITPSPGWGTGAWNFSYDAAGNQTSIAESNDEGAVQTTLYDFAGDSRMNAMRTATPTGPARTDVLYDGRGFLRQAHLTVTGSGDNLKATPLYSSAGMLMARTEERTWTGGEIGPDGEDQTFAWANTETTHLFYFAGRPVAQLTTPNPELLYLTTDHLGTPVLVTNGGGGAIWAGGLEPFGAPWTAGLDRPDPEPVSSGGGGFRLATAPALSRLSMEKVFLRYPGQWSSDAFRVGAAQGDVYYNVNRWYQTATGRYERADPLGIDPSTFGINHLYLYVLNRPMKDIDPLGLFTIGSSCDRCLGIDTGSPSAPTPLGTVIQDVRRGCGQLDRITDARLRRCIQKSCDQGRIDCRTDCRSGDDAQLGHMPGFFPGFIVRKPYICINNWEQLRPHIGDTVIHEWAHGCGWWHGQGMGVPGDAGAGFDQP